MPLAERIDINPKYLSSIERGEEHPTLDLLIRVVKGLQVELYELFTFDAEGSPDQLRQKLTGLLAEIPADELRHMVHILEALVHRPRTGASLRVHDFRACRRWPLTVIGLRLVMLVRRDRGCWLYLGSALFLQGQILAV
jgi:transcriptional regulator with XRE-family HTH domain